jgi:DNA repair exonuclease SbcCD ATPase subunit
MKEIKLLNLTISNWRGQNHNIDFRDKTFISAKNGAGKSTLLHAWLWALTGYTEVGLPKNTNLFDNREVLSEHTPWASVVATMEIDGYEYVVERKSKPKFTRSKGSLEFTKGSSDLYEYYIDNIEVGASGITNFVEGTIGVPCDMLVYCLSGDFFSYLASEEKNKARNILCSIAGEVKPEDFKGDYSAIAELMERYSTSEIVEMSKKKKKPLEERQNIIPDEIDRKEERLSELRAMDFTATEVEIEKVKTEIEAIDGLLLGNADAVKPIVEHNREIENKVANKRLSLVNGRLDHKEKINEATSEIKGKIAEVKRYNEGVNRENGEKKREWEEDVETKEVYERKLSRLTAKREELLKRRDEVKGRVYAEETCAYCGQELPYEMLEKARAKFNETKAKDLELIVAEGKEVAEEISKTKEKIEYLGKRIEAGYTLLEKKDLTPYEEALARVEASFVPYEETEFFKQINAEIDALMSEIKEIPSNDNEALTSRKKALIEVLSELSKKLGLKDEISKVEKDIEDLRSELRSVANSIAEIEGHIFAAQAWLQERNEIVSFRINEKLEYSKIEMFSTQKNGEVVADCRLVNKKGVSYGVTNNADKGAIDTDLQKLFMRHYDIALPIFVDEASIYDSEHLPKDDNYQFVYLFASDSPILKVE